MKILTLVFFCILALNAKSQKTEDIVGLWLVEEVQAGSKTVTPVGKWTRFNKDFTQESGNGWFQHSFGTWIFDVETQELEIVTSNGLEDPYGAFKVQLSDSGMIWERNEEGMDVIVTLKRCEKLPTTYRDQLLGLWQLEEANTSGFFFEETSESTDYLHIRWDGKFVVGSKGKKTYGVYNVHGHKSEIELIPYGDEKRSFWSVKFLDEGLEMKLLNSDGNTIRRFRRVRSYPE